MRAALLCLVFAAGCNERNPNYCPDQPENLCQPDAAQMACAMSSDCTGAAKVCKLPDRVCVQCTPDEDAACTGTTPICSTSNTCTGCKAHTDCPSAVCMADGSCADESTVAYVQAGGTGTACTKASPCGVLDAAIQANRRHVKISAGLVKDNKTTIIDGKTVTIVADPGAKLDRDGDGAILEVRSTNADVTIVDLEITGATGAAGANGIDLVPNGGTPKLTLTRVKVDGNQGVGISVSGGTLTVGQSTISTNLSGGISMASTGVVSLTNNFIHHNGNTSTASFGGLSLRPIGASKVEFNTIIDNQATFGAASAGGVFCDTAGFVAPNNIIFRNTGGTGGSVQTFGICTYGNSFNMPGTSAVDNTPGFQNPNSQPFNYHLTATSPTTVRDAAGACSGVDFDGDARPIGGACDLGADELTP